MQIGIQKLEHPCTLKVKGYCQGTGPHRQFSPDILQKTSISCIRHFLKGLPLKECRVSGIIVKLNIKYHFPRHKIIPAHQFIRQRTHHSACVRWSLLSENSIWSRTLLLYFGLNVNDIHFQFLCTFIFCCSFSQIHLRCVIEK